MGASEERDREGEGGEGVWRPLASWVLVEGTPSTVQNILKKSHCPPKDISEGLLGFVTVIDEKKKRRGNQKYAPHLHQTKTHLFIPTGGKDGVGDPHEGDEERSLGGVGHDVRRDGVLRGRSARGTQQVMGGVLRHSDPLLRAQPPVTSSTLCSAKPRSAPEQRALPYRCTRYYLSI